MQGLAWDDVTWDIVWHLSLAGGIDFSYSSCHELHEALLLWSEPFFTATGSSEVTTTTSRLNVVGPASAVGDEVFLFAHGSRDRKSTRLNSSHVEISYAVFCLKKKKITNT